MTSIGTCRCDVVQALSVEMGNAQSGETGGNLDASTPLGRVVLQLRDEETTLTKVDFGGYGVGDKGVELLAPLLFRGDSPVRTIQLQSNGVSAAGACALALALADVERTTATPELARLDLSRNSIADEGASALAAALAAPGTLRCASSAALVRLDLSRNHVADGGAVQLASALTSGARACALQVRRVWWWAVDSRSLGAWVRGGFSLGGVLHWRIARFRRNRDGRWSPRRGRDGPPKRKWVVGVIVVLTL